MGVQLRYIIAVLVLLTVAGCQTLPPEYESRAFVPTDVGRVLHENQPYTISILGDSTGNNSDEWVHLVGQYIAVTYDRPVTVHDWTTEGVNAYTGSQLYPGGGAPVTVWNGSGAGAPAQYSVEHFAQLAPEPANLTIISHSHNDPARSVAGVAELVNRAYDHTLPGGGTVVVLQNPRTDGEAQQQQANVDRLREIYAAPNSGVGVVDVNGVFRNSDLASLLQPDGAHPNPQGSRVWADTVIAALHL